jgi:Predicted xylanase/chitin deacetylase
VTTGILLIPERPAGWTGGQNLPLLDGPECGAYSSLVALGLTVKVRVLADFLEGESCSSDNLVVVSRPDPATLRKVKERMRAQGGRLLVIQDDHGGQVASPMRLAGGVELASTRHRLKLTRQSRLCAGKAWKQALSLPMLASLDPASGDEVVGKWSLTGGAALLYRKEGVLTIWRMGFPLDHLDRFSRSRLCGLLVGEEGKACSERSPIPGPARAVVMLLHDVEEALPGDQRGTKSVRDGLEACLGAQAERGIRATYNLVGTFAEEIPDLVRRITTEGHEVASHGGTHRVVAELADEELREDIQQAESRIEGVCGMVTRGFRSPRSRWSLPLLELLQTRRYLWNAEADPSPFPYIVPRESSRPLVRIPVAADDWDYVKRQASPVEVSHLWMREVRSAMDRRCWVAIGSHPSVLGIHRDRMSAFSDFLQWLSEQDVAIMTLGEGARWWLARDTHIDEVSVAGPAASTQS